MDNEQLRQGLEQAIPFNVHNNVEVVSVAPNRCVARLPEAPHLKNHVGTQHGGALFAVAETAAGGAFIGAVGERIADLRLVARGASITYTKFARGAVLAESEFTEPVDELLSAAETGAEIEIPAVIKDESTGEALAEMTFTFQIKKANNGGRN